MIEEDLRKETEKWLVKIKGKRKSIMVDKAKSDFLKNIDAYISDSEHFLKKNDMIRAFEAVIWAWSWLEIGENLKILRTA